MTPPPDEYCLLWINWWATCMSKGEWSGWMQAIGSIAAIAGAAGIAWFAAIRQHQTALAVVDEQVRLQGEQADGALDQLSRSALVVAQIIRESWPNLKSVRDSPDSLPFAMDELLAIEKALEQIGVQQLPGDRAGRAQSLAGQVRVLRINVEIALRSRQHMSKQAFDSLAANIDKVIRLLAADSDVDLSKD